MNKTKPAICGFFNAVFQKNECKTSITMPRIKSTTPTVILSVLGFTLFAISAASCAVTSVLNMQVIIAVVSGKTPIPNEMGGRAGQGGKRHDKHACADRLFKRKSHKRREHKEHHHATARADESANHTNHCRQRECLHRVAPFVFVQAVL